MKKLLSILLVSFLTLGLMGCGEDDDSPKGEKISAIGELKPLGGVLIEDKADHILEAEDGKIYYVYSSFVDLDKDKFKDSRVQISGQVTAVSESGKEVVAVEAIVPLSDEVVIQDSKQDVEKKYQNLTLGFRLERLKNLSIAEDERVVSFSNDDGSLKVIQIENTDSLTLDEWLTRAGIVDATPTLVGPDQLKSYLEVTDSSETYYIARGSEYIYKLDLDFSTDELKNDLKTVVNMFRFVPLKEVDLTADEDFVDKSDFEAEISYFNENIEELNPDYGGSDNYDVKRFEFVQGEGNPHYVYVIYEDATDEFRTLFSYQLIDGNIDIIVTLAQFKPGTVVDWELLDGEDPVRGSSKIVVDNLNGQAKAIEIAEGYRLFETDTFDFTVQYPGNWYFEGQGGKYRFNDKPLNGTHLISLEVNNKNAVELGQALNYDFKEYDEVEDEQAVIAYNADPESPGVHIILTRDEDSSFLIWGFEGYEEIARHMAKTLIKSE